ncbi:GntR family transcriptional regulator [Allonocardiopsis opalescens]|uniref:DNA-binding GntR family transcriptional regulator n=1 Tax=Allonocardiopsis opalescens TaxID=1144618 RepID=A0A2T0Q2K8_9ACTN|nr:GntR family transcriptional regulator [Allonocardiopsis opalescens]PRX98032.1 DNA-binding GntR family transcriptional regulator [Allonocardiopsis opalescens]
MSTPDLAAQAAALPPLGASRSHSDLVAESIRQAILSGQLRPDEVLVERRLAEMLGVSKTPVREALIQLSGSGLLKVTRNRGVAVRKLSHQDARHIYQQRLLLEPWALASAVRRPGVDFSLAEQVLAGVESLAVDERSAALALENRRFHRALYSQCENTLVVGTLDGLQDLTALATLSIFWRLSPTWEQEFHEHARILAAARSGRAEEAEQLVRRHIERMLERLEDAQPEGGG